MSGGFTYARPSGGGGGGSHGVLGFVTNLVKDIGDTARGTPEGIIQTVEHPIRTAENVGKATWQTWSPLFHGDVSKFGHQFYDHPLAPMLDIATVFSGGASLAAHLGTGLERVGLETPLAKLGKMPTKLEITPQQAGRESGLTYTKYLPSNPIHNKLYRSAMNFADKNPNIPNWFSSSKVYGRLEKVDWAHSGLALNANVAAMMKAGEVFNKAGHSDWAYLENQLFGRNYASLLQHSPEIPLKDLLPEGASSVSAEPGMKLYRGTQPNEGAFQVTDKSGPLFASSDRAGAAHYAKTRIGGEGRVVEVTLRKDAKVLHITDSSSVRGGLGVPEILRQAKEQGYDAVSFPDQSHEGVAILNDKAVYRKPVSAKPPQGFIFVKDGVDTSKPMFKAGHAKNLDEFANHLGSLDKKFTTRSLKDAVIRTDEHGNQFVKVAHSRALEATMLDAKNGAHFLAKLARYPTTVWKAITLGYSPRVVVNNGIGNWFMYAMRQGGAHSLRGFVDAVRYTKSDSAAMKMLKETGKVSDQHFLNRHFADELGNTFGSSTLGSSYGKKEGVGSFSGGVQGIYRKSFYPLVHRYADVPVRAASISAFLRGDPLVQKLMAHGHSFEDAADTALMSNRELRDKAALHARSVAGDYTTLSGTEQAIRDFVPFYLWDKHIAKHALNMLRDRPGVVTAGTAVGQQGANATRKQLGDIPSWMLGAIKLPFKVPGEGNRTTLLNTQGMNPYSSVPDLVGFAQALTTGHTEDSAGDTILGTVNPVIKGLVEHTMGQKATGAPVTSHGGVLPSTLTDIFNSLRPVQLGRSAAGMSPKATKNPKLYKTDINTILSAFVGAPIQEADLGHAAQLQQQIENGGKKPKKRGGNAYAR